MGQIGAASLINAQGDKFAKSHSSRPDFDGAKARWLAVVVAWITIVFLSSSNLAAKIADSVFYYVVVRGIETTWGHPPSWLRFGAEKGVHIFLFLVLGFLLVSYCQKTGHPRAGYAVAAGVLIAMSSEALQALVPGRDPNMRDVVINCTGVSIGAVACVWRAQP